MSFGPLRPGEADWPAVSPIPSDPQVSGYIAPGSITNDKLGFGLDSRKFQGAGIKVYRSTDQTISTATNTDVSYNTVSFNEGFTAPPGSFTSVTVPYAGAYLVVTEDEYAADSAGFRRTWIVVNGVQKENDVRASATGGSATAVSLAAVRVLAAGDTVGTQVRQTTGGNLAIQGGEDSVSLTVMFLFAI